LAQLARKYLIIPASEAAAERIAKELKRQDYVQRGKISGALLTDLLLISSKTKELQD